MQPSVPNVLTTDTLLEIVSLALRSRQRRIQCLGNRGIDVHFPLLLHITSQATVVSCTKVTDRGKLVEPRAPLLVGAELASRIVDIYVGMLDKVDDMCALIWIGGIDP